MTVDNNSWRVFSGNPRATMGLLILAGFGLLALLGPELTPHDPRAFLDMPNQPPNAQFWLGTTGDGKDVFSQTLAGTRQTLLIGFGTGGIVVLLGAVIGTLGGYFGGWLDEVLSLLTNVFLVLPGLPLAVLIAGYLPPSPWTITLALTVTGWAWHARVARAQALSLRHRDFVLAAQLLGETHLRIITREILPNMRAVLFADFVRATIFAIGAQVGLEFLGLGDVTRVSWGTNLYWAANNGAILTGAWWTILPTGACIALVGFALALVNSGLDEYSNPRLRSERRWRRVLAKQKMSPFDATPVLHDD